MPLTLGTVHVFGLKCPSSLTVIFHCYFWCDHNEFIFPPDTEPPTCWNCPEDILRDNLTDNTANVAWTRPNCSDNSGVLPEIFSTRPNGDLFQVPGTYVVSYTVKDDADNKYTNCSFGINLASEFYCQVI